MAVDLIGKALSLLGLDDEKEREELKELYPEGSKEREILDFSRADAHHAEVPPLLKSAFKLLMGVTLLMALAALIGFMAPGQ